ncbi:MAG TPA: hypothetical protein VHE37_11555, partial [Nevskiaceae bacterium]|nr:hypothetical protein [Nevskiaceae bacterium]
RRLMRRGRVRVAREINEQYETDGRSADLQEHLLHEPFIKGVSHWVVRHNQYSTMEAQHRAADAAQPLALRDLRSADATVRRAAHKRIAYRLPGRPLWLLLYLLFIRGAVLEGYAGIAYSGLRAWYELLIDIKTRELQRARALHG